MERIFDAPREALWKAHTDRDLIAQWWGPRKYMTVVEEFDATAGGKWKMVHKANGEEHVFYGEFTEVQEPEKITWTFTYAPFPDATLTETITFEELPDGKTKVRTVSHYPNMQALEGMVGSGMEEGATESWDRLEELVTPMKPS